MKHLTRHPKLASKFDVDPNADTMNVMAPRPGRQCVPRAWRGFEIEFRYHASRYQIQVSNPHEVNRGVAGLTLDGTTLTPDSELELVDDGSIHHVQVTLG